MNRRIATFFSITALALVVAAPLSEESARAQTPVTADVVAARVQAFYEQTRTVQARFQQNFWNRIYNRTQTSAGRVAIQRPGRIRFDYDRTGKVLVSNRDEYVMYEPSDDGGAGQFARGTAAAASQSAFGFLMGTADLRRYRRTLVPARASDPAHTDVLELTPRRADPHYRRIRVYVDNQPERLGVVHRVSIEDPDGNWNTFDFRDLQFNRTVDERMFTFTPPRGAREMTAPSGQTAPRTASAPLIE